MSRSLRSLRALALIAPLALPLAASAQQLDSSLAATRRDLINQAMTARTSGDHARALDLATRAGQIQMSPSLRRLIAEEEAAAGQLAGALGSADLCAQEARNSTQPGVDAHRAACEALANDLRRRVGRIVVRVPDPPPADLRVTVAGHDLPRALWGVPYVVTPGAVTIEAQATGYAPFRQDVRVATGANADATVALTSAAATGGTVAAGGQGAAGGAIDTGASSASAPSPGARTPGRPFPVGPVVVAGVGAASLIAAGVFAVVRGSALGDAARACGADSFEGCDAPGVTETQFNTARDHYDRAMTFTILTDVALGVGVAAVAGGVLWYALGGRESPPASARASLRIVPRGDGLVLGVGGTL